MTSCGNQGKDLIRAFWQNDARLRSKNQQGCSKKKEEQINGNQGQAHEPHILFGISYIPAAQIFLHHILIQSGHYNGDEGPAQKMLQEVILPVPVIKHPDPGMLAVHHLRNKSSHTQVQRPGDYHQAYYHCSEHTHGL